MIKLGMMIGDRYEMQEKIGTGGMSDVYKALDHKLNRQVAVKILKQEFSENENFVSKFRIEAQAAAGLMHPNIVNVYDVGDDGGVYYIVMELVEGITLKKYIEKKLRLTYKEAVSIAIQVGMGIEAAHNNHIIHRDIKPQNIIISKEGKVKVTDFGIAKAATSNTITSNVMGSVHYTSPEQARGGYSDEKSDIYSMGITMFEMLTGRVPFNGETTVAIAIKHIQEEMPSPREFVPEIPVSVESIVLKCCQKSPDRRYQNMKDLVADLKQSLVNPDDDFVVNNDPDMEGGTRMVSEDEMSMIRQHTGYTQEMQPVMTDTMRLRSDLNDYDDDDYDDEDDDYDYNPRMERVTTFLAVAAGIVILVILIILAMKLFGGNGESIISENPLPDSPIIAEEENKVEYKNMPDLKGMNVDDARNALSALGIMMNVVPQKSDTVDKDIVISTEIAAGEQVEVGSTVNVTVSAGADVISVPNVVGLTYEAANNSLVSSGFLVNKTESYSDDVEQNLVISQNPEAGTEAAKGYVITINVSRGKEDSKIRVPNLINLTEQDATISALEAGLSIGSITYGYSNDINNGYVYNQSYPYGSYVDKGTEIDLTISQGPPASTYKYSASITGPTTTEAPEYVSGEVSVKLVADDGEVLLDTKTASFPISVNHYGLASSGGTITFTYTASVTGTDAEGNPTTTTEEKTFTRRVEFTKE
ncbi:MAG: Stk1 family PASTA domain-containing Ser/Thr kinase [Lachnospiraceae bacterium]|nr:Stk1 family PASTA domain-containing Ser/Thr kinase [Lachnospiraceae bacterium]